MEAREGAEPHEARQRGDELEVGIGHQRGGRGIGDAHGRHDGVQKCELAGRQLAQLDVGVTAYHEQAARAGVEADRAVRIVARLVGAPDRKQRPGRSDQARRGTHLEHEVHVALLRNRRERRQVDDGRFCCYEHFLVRPFEPRDVRKVRIGTVGELGFQILGKTRAEIMHVAARRRVTAQIVDAGLAKPIPAGETQQHRETRFERGEAVLANVVRIDRDAPCGVEAVGDDEGRNRARIAVAYGAGEGGLQVTQRGHGPAPAGHPQRAPRRRGRRARGCRCPIRSGSARRRSAAARIRRAPTRRGTHGSSGYR